MAEEDRVLKQIQDTLRTLGDNIDPDKFDTIAHLESHFHDIQTAIESGDPSRVTLALNAASTFTHTGNLHQIQLSESLDKEYLEELLKKHMTDMAQMSARAHEEAQIAMLQQSGWDQGYDEWANRQAERDAAFYERINDEEYMREVMAEAAIEGDHEKIAGDMAGQDTDGNGVDDLTDHGRAIAEDHCECPQEEFIGAVDDRLDAEGIEQDLGPLIERSHDSYERVIAETAEENPEFLRALGMGSVFSAEAQKIIYEDMQESGIPGITQDDIKRITTEGPMEFKAVDPDVLAEVERRAEAGEELSDDDKALLVQDRFNKHHTEIMNKVGLDMQAALDDPEQYYDKLVTAYGQEQVTELIGTQAEFKQSVQEFEAKLDANPYAHLHMELTAYIDKISEFNDRYGAEFAEINARLERGEITEVEADELKAEGLAFIDEHIAPQRKKVADIGKILELEHFDEPEEVRAVGKQIYEEMNESGYTSASQALGASSVIEWANYADVMKEYQEKVDNVVLANAKANNTSNGYEEFGLLVATPKTVDWLQDQANDLMRSEEYPEKYEDAIFEHSAWLGQHARKELSMHYDDYARVLDKALDGVPDDLRDALPDVENPNGNPLRDLQAYRNVLKDVPQDELEALIVKHSEDPASLSEPEREIVAAAYAVDASVRELRAIDAEKMIQAEAVMVETQRIIDQAIEEGVSPEEMKARLEAVNRGEAEEAIGQNAMRVSGYQQGLFGMDRSFLVERAINAEIAHVEAEILVSRRATSEAGVDPKMHDALSTFLGVEPPAQSTPMMSTPAKDNDVFASFVSTGEFPNYSPASSSPATPSTSEALLRAVAERADDDPARLLS